MKWWRAHHGLPSDAKLAVVLRDLRHRASPSVTERHQSVSLVTRAEILAVWVSLLDFASQNSTRGSIDGVDHQQIAVLLDLEYDRVSTIISAFEKCDMVDGNVLKNWAKRQVDKEDNSRDRTRKWRESRREEVTPRDAAVTLGDAPLSQDRDTDRDLEALSTLDGFDKSSGASKHTPKARVSAQNPLNGHTSQRYVEWIEGWKGRLAKPDDACRAYLSCVSVSEEQLAFACRDRYNQSAEIGRAPMEASKFLMEQKNNKWQGKWPNESVNKRLSTTEQAKALWEKKHGSSHGTK